MVTHGIPPGLLFDNDPKKSVFAVWTSIFSLVCVSVLSRACSMLLYHALMINDMESRSACKVYMSCRWLFLRAVKFARWIPIYWLLCFRVVCSIRWNANALCPISRLLACHKANFTVIFLLFKSVTLLQVGGASASSNRPLNNETRRTCFSWFTWRNTQTLHESFDAQCKGAFPAVFVGVYCLNSPSAIVYRTKPTNAPFVHEASIC